MIEVRFKKSNIRFSMLLCVLGLSFFLYLLISQDFMVKIISVLWLVLISYFLFIRYRQLNIANKGIAGLEVNEEGIINRTPLHPIHLNWYDIESFQTGFYRTSNLFINPKDLEQYKDKRMVGFLQLIRNIFSPKPEPLWIDTDVLDIEKKELLKLLNGKLREKKHLHIH